MSGIIKLKLKSLASKTFDIIDPNIRFGTMNVMALISKMKEEQPSRVEITYDDDAAQQLIFEIAMESFYNAEFEGHTAILLPPG